MPASKNDGTGTTKPERKHTKDEIARVWKFIEDFAKESDRAAVIVGAARIDEALCQMLVAFLLPSTSSSDELLDNDRPLGTFSSRIHLCYRLGLIDADLARALHLIRKIRNGFAHDSGTSSLDSGSHADRIRELVRPFRKHPSFDEARDAIAKNHTGLSAEFRTILAMLSTRLEIGVQNIERVCCKPAPLIPPAWEKQSQSAREPANKALNPTGADAPAG